MVLIYSSLFYGSNSNHCCFNFVVFSVAVKSGESCIPWAIVGWEEKEDAWLPAVLISKAVVEPRVDGGKIKPVVQLTLVVLSKTICSLTLLYLHLL